MAATRRGYGPYKDTIVDYFIINQTLAHSGSYILKVINTPELSDHNALHFTIQCDVTTRKIKKTPILIKDHK